MPCRHRGRPPLHDAPGSGHADLLCAGLAAGFAGPSESGESAGGDEVSDPSILARLDRTIGAQSRILLWDAPEGATPLVRPLSTDERSG